MNTIYGDGGGPVVADSMMMDLVDKNIDEYLQMRFGLSFNEVLAVLIEHKPELFI